MATYANRILEMLSQMREKKTYPWQSTGPGAHDPEVGAYVDAQQGTATSPSQAPPSTTQGGALPPSSGIKPSAPAQKPDPTLAPEAGAGMSWIQRRNAAANYNP